MINKQPFFIVVDGIDGSGKTTIAKYIEQKTHARYMRMMGQGPIGRAVREKLLSPSKNYTIDIETLWIFASNVETITDYVAPVLAEGRSVVLDRYWSSTYAYQINRSGDSFYKELFKRIALTSFRNVRPNLYLWCDVDPHIAFTRINHRNEKANHFDTEDILDKMKVAEGFSKIFQCDLLENKIKLNCNADLPAVLHQVDTILRDFSFI